MPSNFFTPPPGEWTNHPASDAQINAIRGYRLMSDEDMEGLTKGAASAIIARAKDKARNPLEEGLYQVIDEIFKLSPQDPGPWRVFKLVKLAEPEEVSNGIRTHKFVPAARSALKIIKAYHRMTRSQAKKFGQTTGTCVRCGAVLDPSITMENGEPRWIGPVCETRMGW